MESKNKQENKQETKVYVITSEWHHDGERNFEINGVFRTRESATEKFKELVEIEKTNCSFIVNALDDADFTGDDEYSEVYDEAQGQWEFETGDYDSWFEMCIEERILN